MAGLAFAVIAGILVGDRLPIAWPWLAGAAVAGLLLMLRWKWGCLVALFFAIWMLHAGRAFDTPARRLLERSGEDWRVCELVGVVLDEPAAGGRGQVRFSLAVESIGWDGAMPRPLLDRVTVDARHRGEAPALGDRMQMIGSLRRIPGPRNPGEFNYREWQRRRGVFSEFASAAGSVPEVLGTRQAHPVIHLAASLRNQIRGVLRAGVEDDPLAASLIQSMVLGLQEDAPPEVERAFRETGTLHLFAVSGLNVAIFAGIVLLLLSPLGLSRGKAVWVAIPLVLLYAAVTGFSPSCVRAALMLTFALAAGAFQRDAQLLNSMAAAAVAILLWDSHQLFTPGFQLSFGVVIALIVITPALFRWMKIHTAPDPFLPRRLWTRRQRWQAGAAVGGAGFLSTNLAAWLGSTPLGVLHFQMISPVAIGANLIAVPLAFVVLALAVASCATGWCGLWLPSVFNNANWLAVRGLVWSVEKAAQLPASHFYVAFPKLPAPELQMTVFDLQTGGAIVIQTPQQTWCVDSGAEWDARSVVTRFLHQRGVNRLHGLVLTHGDAAHLGGAIELTDVFRPGNIFESACRDRSRARKTLARHLRERGAESSILERGTVLPMGAHAHAEVLFPPPGWTARVADDQCLVLRITAGGKRFLLMADSGFRTEQWLMEHEEDLAADVLIMSLHKDDWCATPEFLDRVKPQYLVRGWDDFRENHGIDPEWEEEAATRGITLRRQDQTGAVTFSVRKGAMSSEVFIP